MLGCQRVFYETKISSSKQYFANANNGSPANGVKREDR